MPCSSSCTDGPHASYGECLRSKNLRTAVSIPGNDYDRSAQHRWDQRIDSYRKARSEGIQPMGSKQSDIETAVRMSDATGTAFKAS